uniref:Ovule protein n=1 Tax=Heterorhabditis bacteriophora TaxID=37862 RepID=A0A1I7XVM0_HETBA
MQNTQQCHETLAPSEENHQNGVAVPESSVESHNAPMKQCRKGVQRCAKLVYSMPRRCAAVIKKLGYPT